MNALIIRFINSETIKYFKDVESITSYITQTNMYKDPKFKEILITETYFNRIGMLEIDSNEPIYKYNREEIERL